MKAKTEKRGKSKYIHIKTGYFIKKINGRWKVIDQVTGDTLKNCLSKMEAVEVCDAYWLKSL